MSGWDDNNDSWGATQAAPPKDGFISGDRAVTGDNELYGDGGTDLNNESAGEHNVGGGGDRACFNCGQTGHQKFECTNEAIPREFTGECRGCGQVGHRQADCPQATPLGCKNCGEADHLVNDCKNPRKDPWAGFKDMAPETAWKAITEAVSDRDTFDLKEAVLCYVKATPGCNFADLCGPLQSLGAYLIAVEGDAGELYTFMDAAGNLGKTYQVTFRFQFNPQRASDAEAFPKTPEENLERLKDAGIAVDCLWQKCTNCNELGHTRKKCEQDKGDSGQAKVSCVNCEQDGHRARDCPEPRKDKFACKNCGKGGHPAKECPEPRNPATVECKECNEIGHFSRDCPTKPQIPCYNCGQTGHRKADCTNERVMTCRNCDAQGHISKDCPQPRDWSRVKCSNCGEMGHTKVRCTQPAQDLDEQDGGDGGYGGGGSGAVEEQIDTGAGGGDAW